MKTGPDIVTDDLVFGYDTGFSSGSINLSRGRFFKGPAHHNVLEAHNNSQTSTTTNFSFVYGTEEVNVPKIGKLNVRYCDYNNNRYDDDGNVNSGTSCCPNLFNYHNGHIDVDASTTYTYSIVYKHSLGYTHQNFMYRYEYNSSGTYIKEGGLHSTNSDRRTHLGGGWYHAWGSFTTTSTTARLYAYSFLYNYGLQTDRFSVAKISLVKNSTGSTHFIIPPHLLKEPAVTISSTQSLIDLKRTRDVDVSNVSFNSSGQITFDGTDDKISQPYDMSDMTEFSIEFWAKTYNTGSTSGDANTALAGPNGGGTYIRTGFSKTNSRLSILFYVDGAENQKSMSTNINYSDFNALGYNHYTFTIKNADSMNIYFNGERKATETAGMSNLMTTGLDNYYQRIGNYAGSYLWEGEIPICKLYSKKLLDDEVKQNYNAYKNRF